MSKAPDEIMADPVLTALERERTTARRASRTVQTVVLVIAGIITAVGTGNAHDALSHHSTADPWAWMLYPAVEALLVAELQISAHLAQTEGRKSGEKKDTFDWGFALRLVTGIAAVAMNVWYPIERGDASGAGLHSFGPIIQVFGIEALAQFRKRYTYIIIDRTTKIAERKAKIAARTGRTQDSGVPAGVPGSVPRGVPEQPAGPHLDPPQGSGYGPPQGPSNGSGGPLGPGGNAADPEALKEQAIKLDAAFRAQHNRPASIRTLKNELRIGQDKAVELQAWLAKRSASTPTVRPAATVQP